MTTDSQESWTASPSPRTLTGSFETILSIQGISVRTLESTGHAAACIYATRLGAPCGLRR